MKLVGRTFSYFPQRIPFFVGCTFGIALSLILVPLVEERCLRFLNSDGRSVLIPTGTASSNIADDYEPVLLLNGKAKKNVQRQEKSSVVRPRYYSTELGIREKLFIGILTTPNTILTLGSALNRTLWRHANKLVFFIEGESEAQNIDVALNSVVSFADKKTGLAPFHMLRHIADNYINDYDFFFIAKDTTHIRGLKLLDFVSHVSISQSVHVGKGADEDSLYCSVDAGILLTNNIVKKTVEDLNWCIKHAFSESHSDNFGRCVLHGVGQPCVSKIQGLNFISHDISKHNSLETSIEKSSWAQYLKNAVTIYPVSSQEEHYLIHHYFSRQELADDQRSLVAVQEQIIKISNLLPSDSNMVTWPIGIEPSFKPHNRFDVIQWIYFNESHSFQPNEVTMLSELKGLHKAEIQDILKASVNWVRNKYSDKFIFQKMVNGYKRFDPTRGTEYILDLTFLEDETGKTVLKRINAVRPLNEVEIVPVPFVTEHTRIILLLVINTSEKNGALKFLEDYAKSCLDKKDNTVLLLVFLYGPNDPGKGERDDPFEILKTLVNTYTTKYRSTGAKIAWLSVRTFGKRPPDFAILDLVSRKLSADSMILMCQVGMEIHSEYLNRVRMNTIIRTQVFFPIPFIQFHPALSYKHLTPPDNVEVKKDFGNFDPFEFSHYSFYLSDYLNARHLLNTKIPIVKTDRDLKNEVLYTLGIGIHDIFLKSKLHIMRAVEPFLRLRFSLPSCDLVSRPSTYHECLQRRHNKLGTKSQLAALVLSHSDTVDSKKVALGVDL